MAAVLILILAWTLLGLVFRRRVQFGLRTLLVFVTLCAVVEVVIVGDRDRSDVSQCAALRAANMLYCRERV